MPNLTKITINTDKSIWIDEIVDSTQDPKRAKIDKKLNLKNLKSLFIKSSLEGVFEFFSSFLPQNLITKFSVQQTKGNFSFYTNIHISKSLVNFFANQNTIETLSIKSEYLELQDGIKNLKLNELRISTDLKINLPQTQPQLKILKLRTRSLKSEDFETICKFLNLEVLHLSILDFENVSLDNWALLENFESLNELEIHGDFYRATRKFSLFLSAKNNSLEKLTLPDVEFDGNFCREVARNFPNLRSLNIKRQTQKLNLFAKYFTKLEKLSISIRKLSLVTELDTGIFGINLKELQLNVGSYADENTFQRIKREENFDKNLEIFKIFPNLELLEIKVFVNIFPDSCESVKKFLKEVSKLQNLKSFYIDFLPLENFFKISEDLIKFAEKIETIKINLKRLRNTRNTSDDFDRNWESFRELAKEAVKDHFHVSSKNRFYRCQEMTLTKN